MVVFSKIVFLLTTSGISTRWKLQKEKVRGIAGDLTAIPRAASPVPALNQRIKKVKKTALKNNPSGRASRVGVNPRTLQVIKTPTVLHDIESAIWINRVSMPWLSDLSHVLCKVQGITRSI